MPFTSIDTLPAPVKHALPKHAQDIYKEAFNHAYEEYKDPSTRRGIISREETAHRVAWNAVKERYHKTDEGKWHLGQV